MGWLMLCWLPLPADHTDYIPLIPHNPLFETLRMYTVFTAARHRRLRHVLLRRRTGIEAYNTFAGVVHSYKDFLNSSIEHTFIS